MQQPAPADLHRRERPEPHAAIGRSLGPALEPPGRLARAARRLDRGAARALRRDRPRPVGDPHLHAPARRRRRSRRHRGAGHAAAEARASSSASSTSRPRTRPSVLEPLAVGARAARGLRWPSSGSPTSTTRAWPTTATSASRPAGWPWSAIEGSSRWRARCRSRRCSPPPYVTRSVLVAEEHVDKMVARLGADVDALRHAGGRHDRAHRRALPPRGPGRRRAARAALGDGGGARRADGRRPRGRQRPREHRRHLPQRGRLRRRRRHPRPDDRRPALPAGDRACRSGTCCGCRSPARSGGRTPSASCASTGSRRVGAHAGRREAESARRARGRSPRRGSPSWSAPRARASARRPSAAVDRRVRIPMADGVDSVNVATAAAIALSPCTARLTGRGQSEGLTRGTGCHCESPVVASSARRRSRNRRSVSLGRQVEGGP